MLKIECKIGPKKRGFFRTPLIFRAWTEGEEEHELNACFHFNKTYTFPDIIMAGKDPRRGGRVCSEKKEVKVSFEQCSGFNLNAQNILMGCVGGTCSNCQVFLPWRSGAKPDYSDLLGVLKQIAQDITNMYNDAMEKARASLEIDETEVFVYDSEFQQIVDALQFSTNKGENSSRPSRKVKV